MSTESGVERLNATLFKEIHHGINSRKPIKFQTQASAGTPPMPLPSALNLGLGALPLITSARTRSISAENPTGEKGRGGMAVPDPDGLEFNVSSPARDLGQGWKVRPFIWIKPGETSTLMDVNGPG